MASSQLSPPVRNVALVVGSAFFITLLDSVIIATSLPAMAQSYGLDPIKLSMGLSVYLLALAAFMPLAGWLADRIGAKQVFVWSIVVFVVASALCGVAPEFWLFIVARVVQGLGGALMLPVGRIVMLYTAPKNQLAKAMAVLTWPALTAPVLGPVLGGWITTYINWRWNFYLNIPVGILVFFLARQVLPAIPAMSRQRFDGKGFVLTGLALAAVLYGLESYAHGWFQPVYSLALFSVGVVLAVLAHRHMTRAEAPLLDLAPFGITTFAFSSLIAGPMIRVGVNAITFLLPLMLQICFAQTALEAGSYLFVYFLGNLATKSVTTWVLQRWGFRSVLLMNGLLCALAMVLIGWVAGLQWQGVVLPLLFFAGVVRSIEYAALNTLTYADISGSLRSASTTLASMSMQISMMLAIASSVFCLQLSRNWVGRAHFEPADFVFAFIFMGVLIAVFSGLFLRLEKAAGAEVSGHRR